MPEGLASLNINALGMSAVQERDCLKSCFHGNKPQRKSKRSVEDPGRRTSLRRVKHEWPLREEEAITPHEPHGQPGDSKIKTQTS